MENKTPTTAHVFISQNDRPSQNAAGGNLWTTGAVKRMPWLGLASIVGVLACLMGLVVLIYASAGTEVDSWTLQPSVYIAIIIALLNPLIGVALSEGATIFWWRSVLVHRSTVADLHRNWQHGSSWWHAATAGRKTTLLAAACLLVAIAPLNGPLSQRASHIIVAKVTKETTLFLDAARDLPYGYTGFFSGRARQPSLLSADFVQVVQQFANSTPITLTNSECHGTCFGARLNGIGLSAQCKSGTVPYRIFDFSASGSREDGNPFAGLDVFETRFAWAADAPSEMSLLVNYKNSPDQEGVLQSRNCTFALANVNYPVLIDGNNSVISLDPSTTIFDDKIVRMAPVNDTASVGAGPTSLGGASLALNNQFSSWAHMAFTGTWGFDIQSSGSMSVRYIDPSSISNIGNYSLVWQDPTQDLIAATRELMFRIAIAAANGTNRQQQSAMETSIKAIYETRYTYVGAAAALTLVCLAVLLATFFGYWSLGRQVSMSPVEIGKAFGARILDTPSSNDSVEATVKSIGEKAVSYGITKQGSLQIRAGSEVMHPTAGSKIT